jgi:AraC-like DNA-binding protein/glycerol-3-phosphate cytidylyltransferase-like family protein
LKKLLLTLICFGLYWSSICYGQERSKKELSVYSIGLEYEQLNSETKINQRFAEDLARTDNKRNELIYSLAYVKAIIELSHFDQAFSVLQKIRIDVKQKDNYIKGSYNLVLARLLSKVGRTDEAIQKNELSIQLLSRTKHFIELKNAYINQGFYLVGKKKYAKAIESLNAALRLEENGINEMAVVLRTNRAFISLMQKNTEEAQNWCELAKKKVNKSAKNHYLDDYRIAIIQASIAEINKDFSAEDAFLGEGERIAKKYHLKDNLKNVYYSQSFNASQKGDFQQAHQLMLKVDSLSKILPNSLISERLAVLDLEDKIYEERKTVKLTEEKLVLKSQQQKLLIGVIVIISLALIGISILFTNIRRKRNVLVKQNIALAQQEEKRVEIIVESKEVDIQLIVELEKLIYDKKIYTSSQLTLEKLAKKLNTNRTYLSEAINSHYQTNYSSWISNIRMSAARKLLIDPNYDHYSIEGISKEVGFSSISSFNTLFKKFTGLTPSQFKKERLKQ